MNFKYPKIFCVFSQKKSPNFIRTKDRHRITYVLAREVRIEYLQFLRLHS